VKQVVREHRANAQKLIHATIQKGVGVAVVKVLLLHFNKLRRHQFIGVGDLFIHSGV